MVTLTPSVRDLERQGTAGRDRGVRVSGWVIVGDCHPGPCAAPPTARLVGSGMPGRPAAKTEVASCHLVREGNPTMICFATLR